jgi:hypothetical protein
MSRSAHARRLTWPHWLALVAPPTVWGARLLAGWAIAEIACAGDWGDTTGYRLLQTLVTVGALAVTVFTGVVAWNAARREASLNAETEQTAPFLAISGVLASLLFGLLILVEGSAVYLVGCG